MAYKVKLEDGRALNLENVVSTVQDQGVRLRFVLAVESVKAETLTLWKKSPIGVVWVEFTYQVYSAIRKMTQTHRCGIRSRQGYTEICVKTSGIPS